MISCRRTRHAMNETKIKVNIPLNGIQLTSGHAQGARSTKNQKDTPDLFGGRPGSQAHRINVVLIAGMVGTAHQIAEIAREPVPNVSAQLSWLHKKGLVARKPVDKHRFKYRMSRRLVLANN